MDFFSSKYVKTHNDTGLSGTTLFSPLLFSSPFHNSPTRDVNDDKFNLVGSVGFWFVVAIVYSLIRHLCMCDDGGRHMGYVNLCLLQIEKNMPK